MSAWGHTISSISARERESNLVWGCRRCSKRSARAPVAYRISYRYVTGRAGRVGTCEQFVCEEHGRAFAKNYKLEAPDPTILSDDDGVRMQRSDMIGEIIDGIDKMAGKP